MPADYSSKAVQCIRVKKKVYKKYSVELAYKFAGTMNLKPAGFTLNPW